MAYLSETVSAVLAGRQVVRAILVFFDFASNPMRLWLGPGPLRAGGYDWQGLGTLLSVSGLERSIGGTAPATTFSLSGVDPRLLAEVKAASSDVRGRQVTVLIQHYDLNLVPLDGPVTRYVGRLDTMKLAVSGPSKATISVTANPRLVRRGAPLGSSLSDADQKRIDPTDRLLEMLAQIPNKSAAWPIITQSSSK